METWILQKETKRIGKAEICKQYKNSYIYFFPVLIFPKDIWLFKPKILTLYYGVYNVCGLNIYMTIIAQRLVGC